jgi:predicted transcriptional regulator
MMEIVTLELPETLAKRVKEITDITHRRLEDILVEWIDRAITELPIESLPDDQVLALCDLQMESQEQAILSDLLAQNQEGQLKDSEKIKLDELIQVYRGGLVRKARALKVAVERGLKSSLNS